MDKDIFCIFKTLVCTGHPAKEDKDYPYKLQLWYNNIYHEVQQVIKAIDTALEEQAGKTANQLEFMIRTGRFLLFLEKTIPHDLGKSKRYLVNDCMHTVMQHLDKKFKSLSEGHSKGLRAKITALDTACTPRQTQNVPALKDRAIEVSENKHRQQLYAGELIPSYR